MDLATTAPLKEPRHWSAEMRVLLRPATTFRELARSGTGGAWLLLRRPLLLAFALGCGVSAFASGLFTPRLILDGAVSFAFVPAMHAVAFALVVRGARPSGVSVARAIDLFFTGNGPWLLWIAAVTAIGSAVPPRQVGPWLLPVLASALVPLAWSLCCDYQFFRVALARSANRALRDLIAQRAIAWIGVAAYFAGPAIAGDPPVAIRQWLGL